MLSKLASSATRRSSTSCRSLSAIAGRLRGFDAPTVWSEFTPLSQEHKSVNLGQGFPDWESPLFVKEAMVEAVHENHNQYCRSGGELALVNALSTHYSKLLGRRVDPLTEVTVSVGATEGIFALMQALVNEGDEVVIIEPNFDIYPAQVQMAGGVCKVGSSSSCTICALLTLRTVIDCLPRTSAIYRASPCSTTRHLASGDWTWAFWTARSRSARKSCC